jgi:serpin B
VIQANHAFALDLYSHLRSGDGNIIVSPYSVQTALAMTLAGAGGATAVDMTKTLELSVIGADQLHAALGGFVQRYQANAAQAGYELHVANALWVEQGYPLLPGYLEVVQHDYAASLSNLDFSMPVQAAGTINDWVARQTADKIRDLIPASALGSGTRLVLTNAVYFKGDWETPFQARLTSSRPWNGPKGSSTTPTMRRRGIFAYAEDDSVQALEMPYKGDALAMLILLPKKADGLSDVERSLDARRLDDLTGRLSQTEVAVSMPKFTMDSRFDLADPLKAMGMASAFSTSADFSGIDGRRDLRISDVIHRGFIDVDETGTTAAGATGMIMVGSAMRAGEPVVFNADHPFLFFIVDARAGTILFMGRVEEPASP